MLSIKMCVESGSSTEAQSEISIRDLWNDQPLEETRPETSLSCRTRQKQQPTATLGGRTPATPSLEHSVEKVCENDAQKSTQTWVPRRGGMYSKEDLVYLQRDGGTLDDDEDLKCLQRRGMYSSKKDLFESGMLKRLGLCSGGVTVHADANLEL